MSILKRRIFLSISEAIKTAKQKQLFKVYAEVFYISEDICERNNEFAE